MTAAVGARKLVPSPVKMVPTPSVVDVVGPVEGDDVDDVLVDAVLVEDVLVEDVLVVGSEVVVVVDDVVLDGGAVLEEVDVVGRAVVVTTGWVVGLVRTVVVGTVVVGIGGRVPVDAGRRVGVPIGLAGIVGLVVDTAVDVVVAAAVVVAPGTAVGTWPRVSRTAVVPGEVGIDVDGRVGTVANVPKTVVEVPAEGIGGVSAVLFDEPQPDKTPIPTSPVMAPAIHPARLTVWLYRPKAAPAL